MRVYNHASEQQIQFAIQTLLRKAAVIEGTEPNFSFTALFIVFKCPCCLTYLLRS